MAILPIRQLGDPVLRQPAKPVEQFDVALFRLVEDMIETMYDAPGVGLAAPQIGRSIRLFVFDDGDGTGARALVNPTVSGLTGEEILEEGCLSIRGPYAPTKRATGVHVTGQSLTGARALVNPTVSGLTGEEILEEGCLSIRGPYAPTKRATGVHVTGQSLTG